ncbi:hypothetical protein GCM10020367_42270 [Streptomyces sannanensis]|uniref:Integral membrane protein n=1 Tax=Streptomyces sannanensis TaxID=285536 RepID=A0ABP6SF09_9ACTN
MTVDPVKPLLHRHRTLCEHAVDPLEIAAGLEARGVTDRSAARFRHRDVFSLAEELYARVPRGTDSRTDSSGWPQSVRPSGTDAPADRTGDDATWALWVLAPGLAATLAVVAARTVPDALRSGAYTAGAVVVAGALVLAARRGPLRGPRTSWAARLCTAWLVVHAVLRGDPAVAVALACAVVPAAWCAHLFAAGTRRLLASSRGLEEFAARARPVLLAIVGLYICALLAVLTALRVPTLPVAALGALLFLARLFAVHGFTRVATAGLAAAVLAGAVVPEWGVAAVAAVLLTHATVTLARASAHAPAVIQQKENPS